MIEGNRKMAWLNIAEHDQRHQPDSDNSENQEDYSLFKLGLENGKIASALGAGSLWCRFFNKSYLPTAQI